MKKHEILPDRVLPPLTDNEFAFYVADELSDVRVFAENRIRRGESLQAILESSLSLVGKMLRELRRDLAQLKIGKSCTISSDFEDLVQELEAFRIRKLILKALLDEVLKIQGRKQAKELKTKRRSVEK